MTSTCTWLVIVSNEALTWAFKQMAPSPGAKFVLAALADQVRERDHDRCTPGMATLMEMTNQGQRSLTRHLAELVTLGLLKRERRNVGYQERLADVFILSLPANMASSALVANMAPAKMATSDTSGQIDCGQNGAIKEPHKKTTKSTTFPIREDVERICKHLADRIEGNGSRRPAVSDAWRTDARLLLDKDKRSETQVHTAIDWCQDHSFWRSVVLSMPKLREKYDQMRLAAKAPPRASPVDRDAEAKARIRARQADPLSSARSG